jgi:hypothetical protein
MRWSKAAFLAVLGSGCAQFETVDEACRDHLAGEKHGSAAAIETFSRVTCYRRFVGLDQARLNRRVSEATLGHAQYLARHGLLASDGWWNLQEPGLPGFTGVDAYDRLEDAGYLAENVGSMFIWEVLLLTDGGLDRQGLIDAYIANPFLRDVFLAPAWEAGGWAEAVDTVNGLPFAYSDIVLYFPSGARSGRPVAYPADGQTGVPTSWQVTDRQSTWQLQSLPPVAGFPISFTVGSDEVNLRSSNPLNLTVTSSTILGPDGPVDHVVVLPGSYVHGTLWATGILIPTEPLQPGTTYQVEANLSWISRSHKKVELSFETAPEPTLPAGTPIAREMRWRLTPMQADAR